MIIATPTKAQCCDDIIAPYPRRHVRYYNTFPDYYFYVPRHYYSLDPYYKEPYKNIYYWGSK